MKIFKNIFLAIVMIFTTLPALAEQFVIDVYKSPYCGCCKHWVSHLEENGFTVTEHATDNMGEIKARFGVTSELASCHTAVINGKFIEGHVPASDIKKLLTEKSDIQGLSVPGMPAGDNVPGMETTQGNAKYDVLAISKDAIEVYSHYE